jgi:NDP-sugar pyrophosphorylase family protein
MAAGAGSRFGGPKQVAAVGPNGERLFDFAVFDARRAGFGAVVVVVGEDLEREFSSIAAGLTPHVPTRVVVQRQDDLPEWFASPARAKPWGTGHAVLAARGVLDGPFAVVNADDFYGADAYRHAVDACRAADERGVSTVVAMRLDRTLSPHGPVTRGVCVTDAGHVTRLEEVHDIVRQTSGAAGTHLGQPRRLTGSELVSMNFWVFPRTILSPLWAGFEAFLRQQGGDATGEYRLPEAVSALVARGATELRVVETAGPWFGLTHADDRDAVARGLRELGQRGVYPQPLWRT